MSDKTRKAIAAREAAKAPKKSKPETKTEAAKSS